MEEILASHPAVAECAVFGVNDELKGEVPRGLVVLKAGVTADPDALAGELARMIRDRIGPIATLSRLDVVPGLPKRGPGRSCGRPCAASRTATTSQCPPRLTTRLS